MFHCGKIIYFTLCVLLFLVFSVRVSAKFLVFPSDLYNFREEGKRIEKIILSPIKKNSVLKVSNEKYSQELIYYFSKKGFKTIPIHYITFENGDYFVANKNLVQSRLSSNLDIPAILILLVYENELDVDKFRTSLNSLISNELSRQIRNSAINSIYDIELREFMVNEEDRRLDFKASQDIGPLKYIFQNIDYSEKNKHDFSVSFQEINSNLPPGVDVEVRILIKNTGTEEVLFGKSMILQGRFDKDSIFYSSNRWQNTRTMFIVSSGGIELDNSKVVISMLRTPLLPGKYTENMNIFLNDQKITEVPVSISVADIGQKVLRIKPNSYGYLIVRQEASPSSPEISRVATGIPVLYTEEKNGFYKIKVSDKEGWVPAKFVEILKSK